MPAKKTIPRLQDIIGLLPHVTDFTNDVDRSTKARILWHKLQNKSIPLELILSADISADEYEQYITTILEDYKVQEEPSYKFSDVLSRAYPNLKTRAASAHVKSYCQSNGKDYAALRKATFSAFEAAEFCLNLKNWAIPKSRIKAASNAGKASALMRYAQQRRAEFVRYVKVVHKGVVLLNLLSLWTMSQENKSLFKQKPEDEKKTLYDTLKSFREKKLPTAKKKLGSSGGNAKTQKVSLRSKQKR
jgi:hypothetical protein